MTKFIVLAAVAVIATALPQWQPKHKPVHKPEYKPEYKPEPRCKTGPNGVQPHDLLDFTGECRCPDWHKYDEYYGGCLKLPIDVKESKCKTGSNGVQPHDLLAVTGECRCPDWHKYDDYEGCVLLPKVHKPSKHRQHWW